MGTRWSVTVWDVVQDALFTELERDIVALTQEFDRTYSRFLPSSLVSSLATHTGTVAVPADFVAMLRLYETLYACSGGTCTPLIGFTISDLGYDAAYSLRRKNIIRPVPPLQETVRIVDDEHIDLNEPVLFDLGAVGKGYCVDKIAALLEERGIRRFLVDGSGDCFYRGNGEPIRVGLEHPDDATKAIGVVNLSQGALSGSGGNRRVWEKRHHIIDPVSHASPTHLLATWALAENAAVADGVATALFLSPPEPLRSGLSFEYLLLNDDYNAQRSTGFPAELFASTNGA